MTNAADKLDKVGQLLDGASRATADREHGMAIGCTEWQDAWCPIHGDCCCENDFQTLEWRPGTNGCKLHSSEKTPIGLIVKYEDGEIMGISLDKKKKYDASGIQFRDIGIFPQTPTQRGMGHIQMVGGR